MMSDSLLVISAGAISLVLVLWGIFKALRNKAWLASVVLLALTITGVLILFFHPLLRMHSGAILLACSASMMVAYSLALNKARLSMAKVVFPFLMMLTSGTVLDVFGFQFSPLITLIPAFILYLWVQFERRLVDEDLFMETALLIMVAAFVFF